MKKNLLTFLTIILFQASFVLGQDNSRKHGRNHDDGGSSNSGGGRNIESHSPEEKQVEKEAKQQEKEKKQAEKRQHQQEKNLQHQNQNNGQSGGNAVNQEPGNTGNGTNAGGGRSNRRQNREFKTNDQNRNPSGNMGGNTRRENSRSGSGENLKADRGNRHETERVPANLKHMGISHLPTPLKDHDKILRTDKEHSKFAPPQTGPGGKSLAAKLITGKSITGSVVRSHMGTITANTTFISQINVYNRSEVVKGNYYWHTGSGFDYCHYFDPWGYHWYGWYMGPTYFWTRYYRDNWWWYDGIYDRWCYWHAGGWWWQDPFHVNIIYVYHNNNYTPVDNQPYSTSNDSSQVVYQSNDGTRKVKVMGDSRDAFLYDSSNDPSFDPVFLASGVKDVKFSDTSNNRPLQIILTLNDGSFQMFDGYGNGYNSRRRND